MKKHILSLITLLAFFSALNAQEMLQANGKKYTVADIESIDVITVRASLADVLAKYPEYSIFSEALEKTGLADTISAWNKDKLYDDKGYYDPANWQLICYFPTCNYIKFTVFAIDNETFRSLGVTDFNSLKAKCAEWYGGSTAWYDYPGKESKSISTGEDYTYTYNVVNMFIRYHILKGGMKYGDLVYSMNEKNATCWNFAFGGEPYNYYETLLPHTIMKIWQPLYHNTGSATNIWINRYRANNTLTNQTGLFGSESMHQLIDTGALVDSTKSDIKAINGFIHTVSKPLIYSSQVAQGVLNERIRVNISDMLPELSSNELRNVTISEALDFFGGSPYYSTSRYTVPLGYCDNISIQANTKVPLYNTYVGPWRAWCSDQMALYWDNNSEIVNVMLRLPSVPTGEYELRLPFPPTSRNPKSAQAYIGTERNIESMEKLGSEFDMTINPYETNIGYVSTEDLVDITNENEEVTYEAVTRAVASDAAMRANGYMRMPASFSRGAYNLIKGPVTIPQTLLECPSNSVRFEDGYGTLSLRRILGTVRLEQDKAYWLGFKLNGGERFWLDFIELVPKSIVNNTTYTEDWY